MTAVSFPEPLFHDIPFSVAVVGGGFTGTVFAIKYLAVARRPVTIAIVEPREMLGGGVAYSTRDDVHLMNAPATVFGIDRSDPEGFSRWLETACGAERLSEWTVAGEAYPPRRLYGAYVRSELERTATTARATVRHIRDVVTDLELGADAATLHLAEGGKLSARQVVLAVGVTSARPAFVTGEAGAHPGYVADPWEHGVLDRLARSGKIVTIGTGLTMLDVAASLERAGFGGELVAISRSGLVSEGRRKVVSLPVLAENEEAPDRLVPFLRQVQIMRHSLAASGGDWQSIVPAIKAQIPGLWRRGSSRERRNFLRFLRRFWETALHRAAPQTAAAVERSLARGRLTTLSGRIVSVSVTSSGALQISLRQRSDGSAVIIEADAVVNCSGPRHDISDAAQPALVRNLLGRGLIVPGPEQFGLLATPDGRVIDRNGSVSDRLSAIGPLMRGIHWESNGAIECLDQAIGVAERLAR
ncbi:FAD/NAD(P)-binding protein [Pseudochelatococcus lubricantis]|uniref:FAD/NAD(P)-binding protein n=1 Tax=Pseudochelatococcus lubricantis TaxID=1538102 RepID=UPI0035EA572A